MSKRLRSVRLASSNLPSCAILWPYRIREVRKFLELEIVMAAIRGATNFKLNDIYASVIQSGRMFA